MEGGTHVRSSYVSMEGFIYRKGFISGVQMYLWRDLYIGRDSYKEVKCVNGEIHI